MKTKEEILKLFEELDSDSKKKCEMAEKKLFELIKKWHFEISAFCRKHKIDGIKTLFSPYYEDEDAYFDKMHPYDNLTDFVYDPKTNLIEYDYIVFSGDHGDNRPHYINLDVITGEIELTDKLGYQERLKELRNKGQYYKGKISELNGILNGLMMEFMEIQNKLGNDNENF